MDSITSLFAPVLRASWYTFCLTACVTLGLPTDTWREQTPENVFIDMLARMLEILSIASIEAYRGMFLRYARGDWLTILTRETYETPRLLATFATGTGEITNTGASTWPIPAGDVLTVGRAGIQVAYVIDGPLTIAPGTLSGLTIRCLTAGTVGVCGVGEINEIVGQTLPDVSVINTSAMTARDIELDADLSDRARKTTGPLSPGGAASAYEYIARGGDINGTVDEEIAVIGITRVKAISDVSSGTVTCYYATASGEVASPDVDAVNAKLLERVVPLGVDFEGYSGTAIVVDVDYAVRVLASENIVEQELRDAIEAAILAFFPTVPINGYPYVPDVPNTGELTANKMVPIVGGVVIGGRTPVNYAAATLNSLPSIDFNTGDFPIPGTITGTVTIQDDV